MPSHWRLIAYTEANGVEVACVRLLSTCVSTLVGLCYLGRLTSFREWGGLDACHEGKQKKDSGGEVHLRCGVESGAGGNLVLSITSSDAYILYSCPGFREVEQTRYIRRSHGRYIPRHLLSSKRRFCRSTVERDDCSGLLDTSSAGERFDGLTKPIGPSPLT